MHKVESMWKKKIGKVFKKKENGKQDSLQSIQLKILDLDTNLEGRFRTWTTTISKWIDWIWNG